jgi:hypothetical protein
MLTPSEMKDRMLELARKDGYIDSNKDRGHKAQDT